MPKAMPAIFFYLLLGLATCTGRFNSRLDLERDELTTPANNERVSLTAKESIRYIHNGEQFVLAVINPLVTSVIVSSPAILLDVALLNRLRAQQNLTFPVILRRDVTIQGDASLPESPTLTVMDAREMFRLVPECTMTFANVIFSGLRDEDGPVQMPGLSLFALTLSEDGSAWSHVAVRDSVIIMPVCYEPAVMVEYFGQLEPPPGYPAQNFTFPVAQDGCINSTNVPVTRRCWPLKGCFESYIYGLSNLEEDGRIVNYYTQISASNATVLCRAAVDPECSAQRVGNGYSCFLQLLRSVTEQLRESVQNTVWEGQPSAAPPPPPPSPPGVDSALPLRSGQGGRGGGGGGASKDTAAVVGAVVGATAGAGAIALGVILFLAIKRVRHQRLRAKMTPETANGASSSPAVPSGTMRTAATTAATCSGSEGKSCGAGGGVGGKATTTASSDISPDEDGIGCHHSRGSESCFPSQGSGQLPLRISSPLDTATLPMLPHGAATAAAADAPADAAVAATAAAAAAAAAMAPPSPSAAAPVALVTAPEDVIVEAVAAAAGHVGGPDERQQQSPPQSGTRRKRGPAGSSSAQSHPIVTPNTPPRPDVDLEVRMEECRVALAAGALDDNGDGGGSGGQQQGGPPTSWATALEGEVEVSDGEGGSLALRTSDGAGDNGAGLSSAGGPGQSPIAAAAPPPPAAGAGPGMVMAAASSGSSSGPTGPVLGAASDTNAATGTLAAASSSAAPPPVVHLTTNTLGKGAFGRVVEGSYRGQRVAVKILAELTKDDTPMRQTLMQSFQQDVQVLSRCHHPNVVRLLAACAQPPRLCLVMELMDASLERVLYGGIAEDRPAGAGEGELMPLSKVLYVGAEVARALAYLHPTVVHRDLKPGNVLLRNPASDRPEVKLTDFGLARLRHTLVPTKHPDAGTPPYLAPECFDVANGMVSHKADIYSLGVLLWEMLAGSRPWEGVGVVAIGFSVALQHQRLPLEAIPRDRVSSKILRLLCQCWDADPQRRPGADEIAKELTLAHQQLLMMTATAAPNSW